MTGRGSGLRGPWSVVQLAVLAIAGLFCLSRAEAGQTTANAFEIAVEARLAFDGEIVEVDERLICEGDGRFNARTAFNISRYRLVHELSTGGMLVVTMPPVVCLRMMRADFLGDVEDDVPEGWHPVIEWFNDRDIRQATKGVIYLSEHGMEEGRLSILEPFSLDVGTRYVSP